MLSILLVLTAGVFLYAGDAACFVDMGFSPDGTVYVFGEYGKIDGTYQGYANIWSVDVARNDFISGENYSTRPSVGPGNKSSLAVFEELRSKSVLTLSKYAPVPVPLARTLYLRENEQKPPEDTLEFEDYERVTGEVPIVYSVRLAATFSGLGQNIKSTLDIIVEEKDTAGNVRARYHVGNPQITRIGVKGYSVSKIFTDQSGRSLVFVIEKLIVDPTGLSVRYMVETVRR
ncbi:MAG: DUF2259 domain-containing protein [Spirochaetaceae bacterium]|nr:DUF2259 domain-containing protein [Spirochaetaceae bacterium]